MAKKDYYDVLGVGRNADEREIKKAYKRLAMKYHPDKNKDDKATAEAKFKEVKKAYEILSDSAKRATYDQYGHAGFENGGAAGPGGFGGFSSDDFGDIFSEFFGGGKQRRQAASRGADLQYTMSVMLEQAAKGVTTEIKVSVLSKCDADAHKSEKASDVITCPRCHGGGVVQMRQGFFAVQQECPSCYGSGKISKNTCKKCHGRGRVEKEKTLSVTIPAGVDTGTRIRLSGEGEAGQNGAPSGDLYVQIKVKPHTMFERDGMNLHCEVPIDIVIATLGGSIEVPTLEGKVSLRIPPQTQTGKVFRLSGKGIKSLRSVSFGDLYCQVNVETPENLNDRQKTLFKELAETFGQDITGKYNPRTKAFQEKINRLSH